MSAPSAAFAPLVSPPTEARAAHGLRVLLISTYDLGHQPFGLASPAAWLARAGATVTCLDLAIGALDEAAVRDAELIAFYLPMHTATRLALGRLPRVRALAPDAAIAAFGLYAPLNAAALRAAGVHAVIGGEFEDELTRFAADVVAARGRGGAGAAGAAVLERETTSMARLPFLVPERGGLAPLAAYAKLDRGDGRLAAVGYTEATRGCRHRCRHCPITPVYDGRFRVVPAEVVLADIAQQVAAGAEHLTFGDPDFLNGPGHALPLVREVHRRHPQLTWDATIKVEHLLRHADTLPELRALGCAFITTAVESLDDQVLERLEKRHTRADFERVVALAGAAGLPLHPTFVAFHPWLSLDDYVGLLDGLEALDLIENVAPVQLAIRLLIPAGSRLLELDEVRALVDPFDRDRLVHPWRHVDPRVDTLQRAVEREVARLSAAAAPRPALFDAALGLALAASGRPVRPARRTSQGERMPVPFLTEPWYCCAEPLPDDAATI